MSDISTQIDTVTVYPDRALVTRRGQSALQSGAQELFVAGLPVNLDTESLRASGRGEVAVRIIGVEVRERPLLKASNATAREVQEELERAQDEGSALLSQDSVLFHRAETLEQLAKNASKRFAESLAQGQTALQNLTELLDYVATQTNQINQQRAELELKKRENAAQQMALASRLKQLQGGKNASERVVVVLLEAQSQGAWELELQYLVRGANWKPIYDARVQTESGKEKFALSLNALVTQNTGENWENVAIKLSTARPGLGSLPPKLDPVWIDTPRPAVASGGMMRAKSAPGAYGEDVGEMLEAIKPVQAMPMPAAAPPPIQAQEVVADVSGEGATVEFSLPHRLSVPSDGQHHRAAIATREFPARFDYFAVPRLMDIAYLRAIATNNSQLSLLEGQVSIFRDGVFVGRATLKNTAPNGEFTLFLGPDEQVRAKREMTGREMDKNFIGNVRRVHFAYSIEVQNLKAGPVKISIQDQIPVSRSENIKIKLRGSQPEATPGDLGLLNWELRLNPNEKRLVRFDYGVEAPRDTQILGLQD